MYAIRSYYVNASFVKLYGYRREEILHGMSIAELSAEPEATKEAMTKMLENGTLYIPLRFHRKKDGTVFPVEIVGGPATLAETPVIFAMILDISKRKLLEQEREQYEQFFTMSPDCMCILDSFGSYKKVNPAFLKSFTMTEADLPNHSP